jgi:hypothetical protein
LTETLADVANWLPHVSIGYMTYGGDPTPIATAQDILTTRTICISDNMRNSSNLVTRFS